ncbi:hypothetical protein EC973_005659 [Apophysomyces ossiformis]|uniref:Uncharacterized protein n=1 Tax=Apophysomyces ossiformis TaxID=679940 RepID=A0A8H7BFX7_9FUNG|nr:hypothetical protein EC973_005659 [Apophysomyces ossiformis]
MEHISVSVPIATTAISSPSSSLFSVGPIISSNESHQQKFVPYTTHPHPHPHHQQQQQQQQPDLHQEQVSPPAYTPSDASSLMQKQDQTTYIPEFTITYQTSPHALTSCPSLSSIQTDSSYLPLNYAPAGDMVQQQSFEQPAHENREPILQWSSDASMNGVMTTTPAWSLPDSKNPEMKDDQKWQLGYPSNMSLLQEGYIANLRKQLDESRKTEDEYKLRIQQLMDLVEKQTRKITELRDELAMVHYQNATHPPSSSGSVHSPN